MYFNHVLQVLSPLIMTITSFVRYFIIGVLKYISKKADDICEYFTVQHAIVPSLDVSYASLC